MDTEKPLYRIGERVLIAGHPATVLGYYKDWPTILKYQLDGRPPSENCLVISHFRDGANPNVRRMEAS